MRDILCSFLILAMFVHTGHSTARDINDLYRADAEIARSLYASAAHERYGPILPEAVLDAKMTEITFTMHRGARFDTVHHAAIRSLTAPMHYQGPSAFVSYAATRDRFTRDDTAFPTGFAEDALQLAETIQDVIAIRIERIVGAGRGLRRARDRMSGEVFACARATNAANLEGANALAEALRSLPAWPWGYPNEAAKTAIRERTAAAFAAHPPKRPNASSSTPSWCADPS